MSLFVRDAIFEWAIGLLNIRANARPTVSAKFMRIKAISMSRLDLDTGIKQSFLFDKNSIPQMVAFVHQICYN